MSWLGKLFGSHSPDGAPVDPPHPALPAGVDRFLPGGGETAFRASVNASGKHPQTGTTIFRAGAGSSLLSQGDAERTASEAAQRHLASALCDAHSERDSYAYAVDRRLEPVVETLALPGAPPAARVTVNSYGALIVNAASALFVDVDTRTSDDAVEEPGVNERAAERLSAVVARNPELGFRVYRTRNGWRYLCMTRLFDARAEETRTLLEALGADAKYVLLCRAQRCFRARLTPKPWRIGARFSDVQPLESVNRKRLQQYLKKGAPFASAHFATEIGSSNTAHPDLRMIVDYHDAWCAAQSGKPLA